MAPTQPQMNHIECYSIITIGRASHHSMLGSACSGASGDANMPAELASASYAGGSRCPSYNAKSIGLLECSASHVLNMPS